MTAVEYIADITRNYEDWCNIYYVIMFEDIARHMRDLP